MDSVKPYFRSKAQEKAWRNSFTDDNRAAGRKLRRDLNELGAHGVAKRDKAQHLAREAYEDKVAADKGRAMFENAVELKHTLYDWSEHLYRQTRWQARLKATKAILVSLYGPLSRLGCLLLGHSWSKTRFQDNALVYKYHEKCQRYGYVAGERWGCTARKDI